MYHVKLDQFSGPLEKLLELIEDKKLEVTTISLAEVTADFLEYLKSLSDELKHPSVLADFVVVASRLLLIKSKSILPSLELTEEEQIDIHDLEARLKLYQEFKRASEHIDRLWKKKESTHSRVFLMNLPPIFFPPKDLTSHDLEDAIRLVLRELEKLIPEKQTIKRTVISIEEKVKELVERLRQAAAHSFHSISKDKPKIEIIILFLAVLHLLRDRMIKTEQGEQFSDIIITNHDEHGESK